MEEKTKKPLIVLTGPTAVGKTELSIRLAKACQGEIISADSMQVYRQLDIGTAKVRQEERGGIPHYMIDEYEPDEEFNVFLFQKKAKEYIRQIHERGNIPILVGGTGFYIQAILYDIAFTKEEEDKTYREWLQQVAKEKGTLFLYEKLRQVDEKYAASLHPNNEKRVIRALEYYHQTGEKFSVHNERESMRESPYQFVYFVLTMDRETLYQRIDRRVDQMIKDGLYEEVKGLLKKGYSPQLVSMQGLGYKEIVPVVYGEKSLDDAIYELKRDTRHFAKRQMTWFRREKNVSYKDKTLFASEDELLLDCLCELKEKRLI